MKSANNKIGGIAAVIKNRGGGQLTGIFGAFILIFVISCFISPNFFTGYNLTIMLRTLAFIGIVSIGQGLLLLLGDIDLSIGAIAGLCAVICGKLMVELGADPVLSICIAFLAGAAFGAANGFLVTIFNLNALVLTIGMQTAYRGLNLVITKGRTITGVPKGILFLGEGSFLSIPIPALFLIGVFIVILFLTKKTVYGRNLYAIGNSRETAKMVGIHTQRVRVMAFAICGALAGLAGILMSLRLASAQPSIGEIWVMPSIAAPVIGGIATTGGIGSIVGALIGGAIMGVISNIIVLAGVNLYWQQVLNGCIVVLAIIFDSLSRRMRKN